MRYVLLASLAISDLLFLILVNSFRIASIAQERWLYGDTMCYLNPLFVRYFYINTVLHLMAVFYDRYDSIVKSPLTYNGTVTKCRVTVLVLIWLIPIGFSIAPFLKWEEYVYNPEVFFCQQGLTVQSNTSGWRIVFALVFLVVPLLVIAILNWSVDSNQQENSRRSRTERKAALDVSIIITAFLLCFLAYWIAGLSLRFFKSTNVPPEATLVTSCILTFSSVCNPIIYSIRKRGFRTAVKKTFLCNRISPQTNQAAGIHSRMPMSTIRCSANNDIEALSSTPAATLAIHLEDRRVHEFMGQNPSFLTDLRDRTGQANLHKNCIKSAQ